jgi:hypothetical protein
METSRDKEVAIATSCVLDDRRIGVRVPVVSRIVNSSRLIILAYGKIYLFK